MFAELAHIIGRQYYPTTYLYPGKRMAIYIIYINIHNIYNIKYIIYIISNIYNI